MGDVIAAGVRDDIIGNAPCATRDRNGVAIERCRKAKRICNAIALALAELKTSRTFDVERRSRRMESICEPFGVAHQSSRPWIFTNAHQDTITSGPWTLDGPGLHL